MIIGIYQSLIIYIIFVFHDVDSLSINIDGNVAGILGKNGTEIKCLYTRENVDEIDRVDILAFIKSSSAFELVAGFLSDKISTLLPQGHYLKGRVTLINITEPSTEAVMIFNKLMCIDDTFYKCRVKYTDSTFVDHTVFSSNMSIQVQVTPSKPDNIFWMKVTADSSSTTPTVPMSAATTSSSSSAETISTMNIDKQNDITASTHFTLQTTDHTTTSSTPSGDDLFIDSSYRTTTQSIEQTTTTTALGISEGDNITVVCIGDVGKPPAEHIFQKYRGGHTLSMTFTPTETSISEISANCSYYRTSNLTFQVTAKDNNAVIRCVVNSSMSDPEMYVETEPIEVYSDISTTKSSSIGSSSGVDKEEEKPEGNLSLVIGIVVAVAVVTIIVVIIVIIACRRRKSKFPTSKNDDSKQKQVTEPRTGDYDYIALEDDAPTKGSNNGLEVEDITKHNAEYLKKQEEEEKKKNESNTPPQPAVYAQVNEATKSKNKPKTESTESTDKQEEDPYAETQEDVYDKAGNSRHKVNENVEHFDSLSSSKQNSNGDNKLSIQTSQVGSYANQGFEKDENRKVATVSPTVRSSSGSQNDEQTNSNRNSQSKKGYENIIGTDQTGISEEETSHRTAL